MVKNILATLGILAVVVGIAVWQFGFLSEQTAEMSKKVDRATAAARANKAIAETKAKILCIYHRISDEDEGSI